LTNAYTKAEAFMKDFESALDVHTESLVSATIGCAMTVHKTLGPGFLERAYERALHLELEAQGIEFEAQVPIWVTYRNRQIMAQRLDMVVGGSVLVEIKAVARLEPLFVSQVVSYLKATGLRVGLLLNFNAVYLKDGLRRIVR
jgi:GxxExxY protein